MPEPLAGDPFEAAPLAPVYLSVTDPRTPEEKETTTRLSWFGDRYPAQYMDLIGAKEIQMKWNRLEAAKTEQIMKGGARPNRELTRDLHGFLYKAPNIDALFTPDREWKDNSP